MAYAAAISVKLTIQRLLDSPYVSIDSSSRQIIESAYNEVRSLLQFLSRLDDGATSSRCKGARVLDGEIREAAQKLEDVLESSQIVSESEIPGEETTHRPLTFSSGDLEEDVRSFITTSKMMEDYFGQLDLFLEPSENHFRGKVVIVGLESEYVYLLDVLMNRRTEVEIVCINGPVGIGKTTLAAVVFKNEAVLSHFECRVWVTVGPKYQLIEILRDILAQVDPVSCEGGVEQLLQCLKEVLNGKRCLIVLDDSCDEVVFSYLRRSLPENNGSRILVTTRLREVALATSYKYNMPFLRPEECWYLICSKIFGEMMCPRKLEDAGKMIAMNCKGHPVIIIMVADLLSKVDKTREMWRTVAAKRNLAFNDAYDEISDEVLGITADVQLISDSLHHDNAISTTKSQLVVSSKEAEKIKDLLIEGGRSSRLGIVSLLGMAGIGKTTLAEKVYNDPVIRQHFSICVWVTVGPKNKLRRVLVSIIAQMEPGINFEVMLWQGPQNLASHLYERLMGTKYLIVLDDMWNTQMLNDFKVSLPENNNGSQVLLTTRLEDVALCAGNSRVHHVCFLNEDESWYLLRQKVFGEGFCNPELEKFGKKIAVNCEGLPLTIVTVAKILSEAEKTPEFWNKVAENQNSVFEDAYGQMENVLYPSFEYLPPRLQACFLYLGVFLQTYKIPLSKLVNLWRTERFLEPDEPNSFKDFSVKCLNELASRSLLMVHEKNYNDQIKTCRLHSAFWYFCKTEARKILFFHRLKTRADGLAEGIKNQRRLCIQNNVLFAIEEVYSSIASTSTARSLLCTGPHHQYSVPVCFCLTLLRVLEALSVCFYEFPDEVVKLVQLRYLTLTYNGKLPPSISKLLLLQFLLVGQTLRIKTPEDWEYLPKEIWNMKELKHLQIVGSNLPDPNGAFLPNLVTLLEVSPKSCSKGVFEGVPKLKKLGIRIELLPNGAETLRCFDHISDLHELESFKCVVVNPEIRSPVVPPPSPLPMFPPGLKKLSLSGLGYPWEHMSIIGLLPNLEVLKLLCYAFQGSHWRTSEGEFSQLQYLLLEDTNLVYWEADHGCFPNLKRIVIKHCYLLKEIPLQCVSDLCKIELVDCNPSTSKLMEIKHQKVIIARSEV